MAGERAPSLLILACVRDEAEADAALAMGMGGVVGLRRADAVCGWVAPEAERGPVFTLVEGGRSSRWRVPPDAEAAALPTQDALATWAKAGWSGVLITSAARLMAARSVPDLAALAARCRATGLRLAFSGGLEPPDVPRLAAIGADVLVLGRALREGDTLDPVRLRQVAALAAPAVRAPPATAPTAAPDRIFVRDLVCAIEVGAYASEHGRTQRVRFDVEAAVVPADQRADAMGDVVSYDLITDAIARLTAGRHTAFVETLAEDLAAAILAEPRVTLVRVRVEKLDLGAHRVGVEIERCRAARARP